MSKQAQRPSAPLIGKSTVTGKSTDIEWSNDESCAEQCHQWIDRYRCLIEVNPDAILVARANQIVFVNAASIALLGITDEAQILGKSLSELFSADYYMRIREQMQVMPSKGVVATFVEGCIVRMDGRSIDVEVAAVPFDDYDGTPVLQVILHDITPRKQAEVAERAQRQLAEASRASLAVLTSSLNVEKVMEQILASAAAVIPCDGGSIILIEGSMGRAAYLRGFAPDAVEFFRSYRFALHQLSDTGNDGALQSLIVPDTSACADWVALPPTQWIRSSIRIPIKSRESVIGMLVLDSAALHHFQPADIGTLEAFSGYCALALENANQFARLEAGVEERTVELRQAKEQVEAILDNSPDGIVLVDPQGRIQQANSAWQTIFACSNNLRAGQSLLTTVHESEQERLLALLLTGERTQIELLACRLDGSTFAAELHIGPMSNGNIVCTVRDVSERKAQERELHFLASIPENVSDAVIATEMNFQIQTWNSAAERIYGWRADEAIGKNAVELLHGGGEYIEEIQQLLFDQGYLQVERCHRRKDGSLVDVLISLSLLKDEHHALPGIVAVVHDITERKRAKDALEASEALYRLVADNINDMVIRITLAGEFLYVSPSSFSLLGYRPEELVGSSGSVLIHPDDLSMVDGIIEHALQEKILAPAAVRFRHREGHYLWLETWGRIVSGEEENGPIVFIATLRDITDRVQSDEILREQRDFLQLIIDNVPDLIFVKDAAGYLQLINEPVAQFYRTTIAAMLGKNDDDFNVDPDEIALIRSQDQAALTTGTPLLIPEECVQDRYFQTTKVPLKNSAGVYDRLLVVASDITERKLTSEALREQRDFLQLVIDSVPDLITVKDRDGVFYLVNREMARRYGVEPGDIIGKQDEQIHHTVCPIVFHRDEDQAIIDSGQPAFFAEEPILDQFYQKTKIPLRNADGIYDRILMIATNISDRKAAEDVLAQALVSEKELGELKSRLVSMASHEFRTPLTAIRATADTLLAYRHKLTSEQVDKRLAKIQEQVVYLTSIIEDVLQLTRLQVGAVAVETSEVDLDALCYVIIDELRSQRTDLHRLHYTCDDSLRSVQLDKKLMRHIITNLLTNAFKYSPDEKSVALTLADREGALVITVQDTGIGIPEGDLAYLFQPFHRAANVGNISGTGLGLVIAKESVELQGGTLTVTSDLGQGSTFVATIPLHRVL